MVGIVRRTYGVLGLVGGAFGVAGWQDDAQTWAKWAEMNPELAGALMGDPTPATKISEKYPANSDN